MSGAAATGRAGRLALTSRLATARRAVELLDRKQRALAAECERLELAAVRAAETFERVAAEASGWLRRSIALDGHRGLLAAIPPTAADVTIGYDVTMGVRHPVRADVVFAPRPDPAGSSALAYSVQAHRTALLAAVRLAAAQRAVALVVAELALTRQQQRALETRWIPRLERRLAEVEQRLDETEREENLRLRWAAAHGAREDR
ncbi:vacuolar-type H+-ATPase subunit D/Vma8 [Kribbella orskensis]|uniref:Vacuolar-type H+-ATPase subunit D/Vma8 n=1 Tax=Kribbella orskensis TaxID=2512216 RepID=A0ABY2B927_9ACTN|nr:MULTISPECIES: V-type ATP synthase subunit D [Kribbella]TCN29611.1 vacuolar-type H+-ATPase subunit D/Vma8 [Kribbella sp. VKM Ac-2500]TCO09955.1 vacuolar-type H+-ATPase subunit D/Vma8 [Kribbella orskensis]